MITWFYSL